MKPSQKLSWSERLVSGLAVLTFLPMLIGGVIYYMLRIAFSDIMIKVIDCAIKIVEWLILKLEGRDKK